MAETLAEQIEKSDFIMNGIGSRMGSKMTIDIKE